MDAGLVKKALCLADAAGHGSVRIAGARALGVFPGEQEAAADRFTEEVEVSRCCAAHGVGEQAEEHLGGLVRRLFEQPTDGAGKEVTHQCRAGADRVRIEDPERRLAGITREDHQV
jgi:hypothetical protein